MFIVIYRGWDNDFHFVRWEEKDLAEHEIQGLWNKVRQFYTREEAEIMAKKKCPFEWEVFEINW